MLPLKSRKLFSAVAVSLCRRSHSVQHRRTAPREKKSLEDLILPLSVTPPRVQHSQEPFPGTHSSLDRAFISQVLDVFFAKPVVRELARQQHLTHKLFNTAFQSFREYCCLHSDKLEPALALTLSDIQQRGHSEDALFPFFIMHARRVFPHLECLPDLLHFTDLTNPHTFYPEAREIHRRIIFHAGPTNSGKTFEALEAFKRAKSGAYCGPLRLLAAEVYSKINAIGLPCDLMTGEDRRFAPGRTEPSNHISSTVEMLSLETRRECAVIDEIQMMRDPQRGYAWTRALLGSPADEVHICGEEASLDLIYKLLDPIGEHVEVRRYERKSPLYFASTHLGDLQKVEDGDCIVCFNKETIFSIARQLKHTHKKECAVIYGDLPPATKMEQAQKFNSPSHSCNVLVATDAIGMGINLNIRRIVFQSLRRNGDLLPPHFAHQIAGRAGRYQHIYETGVVTTLKEDDHQVLQQLLEEGVESIKEAGVAPTPDNIELIGAFLPHCRSFVQLLDIFVSLCQTNDHLFVGEELPVRSLACLIDHTHPISIRDRYTLCLVPLNARRPRIASAFVRMASRYANGIAITHTFMETLIRPMLTPPAIRPNELERLSDAHDLVGGFLWLSYRFPDYFIEAEQVRPLEKEISDLYSTSLAHIINQGSGDGMGRRL